MILLSFIYQINVLIRGMHIIMFTRVALEAVGLAERLYLPLGFLCALTVHIPLLLQMADLPTALNETNDTLIADEEEHHQKDQERDHVLSPFAYLNRLPKLRKSHRIFKILRKVTKKLAYMQIFMYFCSRFN